MVELETDEWPVSRLWNFCLLVFLFGALGSDSPEDEEAIFHNQSNVAEAVRRRGPQSLYRLPLFGVKAKLMEIVHR
jgi:hypothetical protein